MKEWLRSLGRELLPKPLLDYVRYQLLDGWANRSYSQEGEDMLLRRYFDHSQSGFYVDVGAHHPKRFSNTYFFYRRGWRGINIDAMPGSMRSFNRLRKRDINIEGAVARKEGVLTYYRFSEPALNSFSKPLSDCRLSETSSHKLVGKQPIPVRRLDRLLDEHLPENQAIDFMSVDVEGLDLEVLESNDWAKYRPRIVLVEVLGATLENLAENPIARFMKTNDYHFYAKCFHTAFFEDGDVSTS